MQKIARALAYVKKKLYLCTRNWVVRPYGPNKAKKKTENLKHKRYEYRRKNCSMDIGDSRVGARRFHLL